MITKNPNAKIGGFHAVVAFLIWGITPLYWKLLKVVPLLEILAHRIAWAALFVFLILIVQKRLNEIKRAFLSLKITLLLLLSTVVLGCNWGLFIWAVNHDFVLQTSLGYFITPLFNVLLGVLFLGERLRKDQTAAVLLAFLGVLFLALQYGEFPWIALLIALSFAFYSLLRKLVEIKPLVALFVETVFLSVPSFLFIFVFSNAQENYFGGNIDLTLLLVGAGVVTATPLIFFGSAAKNLTLTTLGFFQYLAPTCTFLLAVFLFKEPFTIAHLITFSSIWLALIIYSLGNYRNYKKMKRLSEVEPIL